MNDPRITMEEAGRALGKIGDVLRNTEGGRQLLATLFIGMFLRDWERDRSIWRRMSDRIIDYLIDHYWPLYALYALYVVWVVVIYVIICLQ